MKYYIILFKIFISLNYFSQGVKFNSKKYFEIPSYNISELGFSTSLPSNKSMRNYCPPVLLQEGNSCVGWAVAYYSMSTFYNLKFNITKEAEKFMFSFDPYYMYNLVKEDSDYKCEEPVYVAQAFEVLMKSGCKKMWTPTVSNCEKENSPKSHTYAEPFKIKNYYGAGMEWNNYSQKEKEKIFKSILNLNHPIVIGLNIKKSIYDIPKNGLWNSYSNEKIIDGHAVSIIGYDDNKFGGSFEIINSWGEDFGDNGYFWIKYNDLFSGLLAEFYFIDFYDKFSSGKCMFGNCSNIYSHGFLEENSRYEGELTNNRYNGYGIKSIDNFIYSGSFLNGNCHGYGFIYDESKKQMYKVNFKNGELINHEILGFANKLQKEEAELEEMLYKYVELDYFSEGNNINLNPNQIQKIFR